MGAELAVMGAESAAMGAEPTAMGAEPPVMPRSPFSGLAGVAGRDLAAPRGTVLAGTGTWPVLPALRDLLPSGALRRGQVVTTSGWGLLCLALAAGASAAGAWCAAVGLPSLGVRAAVDAGLDPDRMLLVARPGLGWPQVVASLLDGCDIVVLCPPDQPSAQLRRKLEAAARRHGSVLLVAGEWAGAQTRLLVTDQAWTGIGPGHGRLRARRVRVVTEGRGVSARPRAAWLWLPGPDGSVTPVADDSATPATPVAPTAPVTLVTPVAGAAVAGAAAGG